MYSTPPANAQDLMDRISNEAQLLKEDPQLMSVMGAIRNKLDLCLRRDGAHVEGIGRHEASKKLALHYFYCYYFVLVQLFKNYRK